VALKTGYVFDDIFMEHVLEASHPESPQRLAAIKKLMQEKGLINKVTRIGLSEDKQIIYRAIKSIHSDSHIASVSECAVTGKVAFSAVSGTIAAVDAVMQGRVNNSFCAIRPPGHHAHNNTAHNDGKCQGEGFCFYNNIAIAARYAQNQYECKKILIVDWDYHHGNGTEWAFYNDPDIFFFSLTKTD